MPLSEQFLPYPIIGRSTPPVEGLPVQSAYPFKLDLGLAGDFKFIGDVIQVQSAIVNSQYGGGLPVGIFCAKRGIPVDGRDHIGYWDSEAITSEELAQSADIYGFTMRQLGMYSNTDGIPNAFNGQTMNVIRFGAIFRVWASLASDEDIERISADATIRIVVANNISTDVAASEAGIYKLGCVTFNTSLPEGVYAKTIPNARLLSDRVSDGAIELEFTNSF